MNQSKPFKQSQKIQHPYLMMALSGLLISTLGLSTAGCSKSQETNTEQPTKKKQMPAPVVNVIAVRHQTIPQFETFSGRTVAYETANIIPEITGVIEEVLFQEGAMVKKGQPLYRINPDNYVTSVAGGEAAIKQSEANLATAQATQAQAQATLTGNLATLAQAQADINRYKALLKVDAVSVQAYEQAITAERTARANVEAAKASVQQAMANIETAKAGIESAKASLASNELNLGRTVVKAPISGITSLSMVEAGDLVTTGQTQMLTISQLNPIYVDISQPSANILKTRQQIAEGKVQQGINQVQLLLENGSTYNQVGKLSMREAKVDQATGSVTVRSIFNNPQGILLPGMFVNARVAQTFIPNAILLPQSAIMRSAKGTTHVYIVNQDKKIEVRSVTINGTHENNWIVTSGLNPGDIVVVIGGSKVKPEQEVNPQPLPDLPSQSSLSQQRKLATPTTPMANHDGLTLPEKNNTSTAPVEVNTEVKKQAAANDSQPPAVLIAPASRELETEKTNSELHTKDELSSTKPTPSVEKNIETSIQQSIKTDNANAPKDLSATSGMTKLKPETSAAEAARQEAMAAADESENELKQ